MKLKFLLALIFLPVWIAWGDDVTAPVHLTTENIPFYYETKAAIPTPKPEIAKAISTDYRNAPDEFSAHDLLQTILPVIDQSIATAKMTKTVYLSWGGQLSDYDFQKGGFPTKILDDTFVPFTNWYSVQFDTSTGVGFLPVSVDYAKSLADSLGRNRSATFTVYGTISACEERQLNMNECKVIVIKPTKISITLQNGMLVGEHALP